MSSFKEIWKAKNFPNNYLHLKKMYYDYDLNYE